MKNVLRSGVFAVVAVAFVATFAAENRGLALLSANDGVPGWDDAVSAQPKLLRMSATIDGSGRVSVTRSKATYEHRHWSPPSNVLFDGEPWLNLDSTPPAWTDGSNLLDLNKAWIVKRKGRDVIALEHTPDGFDIYFCDSPNGADTYEVTIAIPRRR